MIDKIEIEVSKKLGLPNYSSISASCRVSFEPFAKSSADVNAEVKNTFTACRRAVDEELALHKRNEPPPPQNGTPPPNNVRTGRPHQDERPITERQTGMIYAIARENNERIDLEDFLWGNYDVKKPEDLSMAEARQILDSWEARFPK